MASLVRPWVVEYRDPRGKKCKKGTPGATRHRYRAAKWYGQGIPGRKPKDRVPLARDRAAARRMLDDLVRAAERGHAGVADSRPVPLAPLLDEFRAALGRKADAKSAAEVVKHARHVLDACRAATVADLAAPGLPAAAEAAVWSLTRPPHDLALPTAAKYGKHARQFCRWLWLKRGLLDRDPLAGIDLPSQAAATPRRDLTPGELARLFAAAEASPAAFRGLAGADRVALYLTAAATGFRAGELARLTPERFDLAADPPAVRPVPRGGRSKTREGRPQPLPPAVAHHLRGYLTGRRPDRPVWPAGWENDSAEMLRLDLAAAGIPEVTPAGQAVFHSLRHSYTSLVVPVTDVRTAQELLRHNSPSLTIGRYAHATEAARAEAVARMALPVPGSDPAADPPTREQAAAAAVLFAALAGWLLAPRLAPPPASAGDSPEPAGDGRRRPGGPPGG